MQADLAALETGFTRNMSQFFQIHETDPQQRLLNQAADIISQGGVAIYPTDSSYAIGCHIGDKQALERIRRIRQLDDKHHFTLMCRDLSEIATYAKVSNSGYRFLKAHTPGPYTFIQQATHQVPRRLQHAKRKSIGIRVPDHPVTQGLLMTLSEPIMSVTMLLPGDEFPLSDPYEIRDILGNQVDLVIDGGYCGFELTTVVDLIEGSPIVLREGLGSISNI
jgi:tRNA threonylcarbamoyl adenosine modification protein (Sua5/YciO/YrdC/YwlC family)